jgi:hypothetical protein
MIQDGYKSILVEEGFTRICDDTSAMTPIESSSTEQSRIRREATNI